MSDPLPRSSKSRFILVDPSFDGKTGDKWQYAVSFLASAERHGFEFVLLAHKDSPSVERIASVDIDQRNAFDHNFYGHDAIAERHRGGARRQALAGADAACDTALAELDNRLGRLQGEARFVEAERLRVDRATLLARHVEATAEEHAALASPEQMILPFNRDDFARVLASELVRLDVRKGDVLFMHTATQAMLESLSEVWLYRGGPQPFDIDAYFLLHFGIEAPDARTFVDRYYSFSHVGSLGLRLKNGSPFRSLFLLSTNAKLRDELEAQLGLAVGIFDGLTNLDRHLDALGGSDAHAARREAVLTAAAGREVVFGARIADLDEARLAALEEGAALLERQGYRVRVRLAHHAGNLGRAIEFAARCNGAAFELVDTEDNADYIRFLAAAAVMVLPYRPDVYRKRVSAVLHDCAVLGISCIVPRASTLEDGRLYADVYTYGQPEDIPGAMLRAADALALDGGRAGARSAVASRMFASDVIERLLRAMPAPSVSTARRGPTATVIMPLWGRVGSSYAVEAQIRFLLERGDFVVQLFVLDKPADHVEPIPHFWTMLLENSREVRGHIQRIAYRTRNPAVPDRRPGATGFDVFLDGIAANSLWDDEAEGLVRESDLVVVNHVFNGRFARRFGAGPTVLETHDIQSHQMVHWPLRNPATNQPESFERLFHQEVAEVARFDYVVNVSDAEHARLMLANPKSRVVTPYVPSPTRRGRFESVDAMARALNWDSSYLGMSGFDLLLLGDGHRANVESALWFVETVFQPFIQPLGIDLAIAGRLSDALYSAVGGVGHVFYCGFVDSIHDVRDLSRVTILPDRRGSGISIKTLETLAHGGAFVATSVAMRGIADRLATPVPVYDEPDAFARRTIELVRDPLQRQSAREAGRLIYEAVADKHRFDTAWREICASLPRPYQLGATRP